MKRTLSGPIFVFLLASSIHLVGCDGGGTTTATVGGTVSGLGSTIVLQNNGADDLTITADGTFTFATALADGASYAVTVLTQPRGQTCAVANGTGTIASADVTNVAVSCQTAWIDLHAHPTGYDSSCMTEACIDAAIATMDTYGVVKTVFFSPPSVSVENDDDAEIAAVVALRPDRLLLGVGGGGLNPLIQRTPDDGRVSEALRQQFLTALQTAEGVEDAVVWGEIASLHLSYSSQHPYEETQADTPLFVLLAEHAADLDMPIDLHMDAVSSAAATPQFFVNASPNNPAELPENITALETLLDAQPDARIVWAHVGRDTTGQMTATLVRRLVEAHPNLFLQLAPAFGPLHSRNAIVDENDTIRSEWLSLIEDYADRCVLGTDTFYTGTDEDGDELGHVKNFLGQLPADLAYQIGCENPMTIYQLSSGC